MKNLNVFNQYRIKLWGLYGDATNGKFIIPRKNKSGYYQVIASDGLGWDHVSACLLDNQKNLVERSLRWEEMCEIKEMFFEEGIEVVQIHPKKEDYIDDHPYVLHLWRPNSLEMPLPTKNDILSNYKQEKELLLRQGGFYLIKKSSTEDWQHISVVVLDNAGNPLKRFPKWSEMCEVKDICFSEDEAVIQVHSNIDFNNENSVYALHLWRPLTECLPLPDSIMVGITKKYSK